MARKQTPTLTEAELRLMDVIWDRGEATVHEVLAALPPENSPAYNTVLTIMRILEQKGYLSHEKHGRAHRYRPLVGRMEARQKAVRHMVSNFFNGSPQQLMLNMIESRDLGEEDLKDLKRLIEESERG